MDITGSSIIQILLFMLVLLLITKPLGLYLYKVFNGERTWLSPVLVPVEKFVYKISGVKADQEQSWVGYTISMLIFSLVGVLHIYLLERTQQWDGPFFNPQGLSNVSPQLAFNTAVSFVTNTNWQNYGGEQTMTYLTQMAGLATHNFMSAATGIALAVAVVRGLTRRSAQHLGNFWVDLLRCILYILIPISIVGALFLVSQGAIQNFLPYVHVTTLQGTTQIIAQGPVASQEFIKELGTNGGGFFNTNSAHPYENPTAFSSLIEVLAVLAIPAALVYFFGRMAGNTKQGWAIWAAMAVLFLVGVFVIQGVEQAGNPLLAHVGAYQANTAYQGGGNMEGKDVRFGITLTALFDNATTATSCGAVNGFIDSFMPLAGMIPMANIALGELIFGGVGSGLYDMLVFVIVAVFIAGLMVGRTPEYLGKKIEQKEMKMAALAILILPASILGFTALAAVLPAGTKSILNAGPHGLSEMLYAFTSQTGNNGSAFGGLSGNTNFYNWTGAFAMLIGRFAFIVPTMALAGAMVKKKVVPANLGTFPTTGPLFVVLLIATILVVGALTFFPAYSLGPIVEQLQLLSGKTF
ncbi:MAG TPA: potassium-transporting ATPase subunit KdpA [Dictyobacter sp.]|jgi:K+-transporting ATPase ATPase A chain|nr:potassium-transporting ATPase subunit KdpA [Dictyobacter sp.]